MQTSDLTDRVTHLQAKGGDAVLGNLPARCQRSSNYWAGTLSAQWAEIQPGILTQAEFILK